MKNGALIFALIAVVAVAIYLVLQGDSGGSCTAGLTPGGNAGQQQAGVLAFAQAIAVAENVAPAHNNPGALSSLAGGTGTFGAGLAVFASCADGWNALYRQLNLIISGGSSQYWLDMSVQEMAQVWTATNPTGWARTVANQLGISVDQNIGDVLAPSQNQSASASEAFSDTSNLDFSQYDPSEAT